MILIDKRVSSHKPLLTTEIIFFFQKSMEKNT